MNGSQQPNPDHDPAARRNYIIFCGLSTVTIASFVTGVIVFLLQ